MGRWRLIPKQVQDFTGLRCRPCSITTKKALKERAKIVETVVGGLVNNTTLDAHESTYRVPGKVVATNK